MYCFTGELTCSMGYIQEEVGTLYVKERWRSYREQGGGLDQADCRALSNVTARQSAGLASSGTAFQGPIVRDSHYLMFERHFR